MPALSRVFVCLVLTILATDLLVSAQEKQPADKVAFKRRDKSSDEDLRKELLLVPQIGFDQAGAKVAYTPINKASAEEKLNFPPDFGVRVYNKLAGNFKQPDWVSVPWRAGLDCQLGKESAERLQVFSVNLRRLIRESVPANDVRPNADKLRSSLTGEGRQRLEWDKVEAIPTLVQMMQAENTPIRSLLVEMLAKIDGKEASLALAQRAVFDLSPEVREKAVEALASRPRKDYQQFLVDGLRWPWNAAADHAAEAIAALQIKDAVPDMVKLLKEPAPGLPFTGEAKTAKNHFVREVVRVNHLSNCALCHALSTSKEDLVRGRVPAPGEDMPPLYYAETSGLFVRADITYLRQDFSVVQPVSNPVKWPGHQRFDYLVRTRLAKPAEIKLYQALQKNNKLSDPYPQRESLLFALREVTKMDLGSRPEQWEKLLNPIRGKD